MSGDNDEGREVIDLTAIARDDQLVDALAASLAAGDLRAAEAVASGDPVVEFLKAQPQRRLVILVTGSRDYSVPERIGEGRRLIRNALSQVVRDALADEVVIRHGDCRGADKIAHEWACEMQRLGRHVEIDGRPAEWDRYGRGAGFIRNGEMVDDGADVCLAFPIGRSPGTRHCIALARAVGIPVRIYEGE